MKTLFGFFLIAILFPLTIYSQTRTVTATGNWDNTATWQSGSIADVLGESVAFTAGEKTATVRTGFNYTVGAVALGNSGNLDIVGTLSVGNAANSRNLTATDGAIAVSGTLTIWGDVIVIDAMDWSISGTVIIKGDLIMGNNATLTNSGNLTIDGDLTAGTNTQFSNNGSITVGDDVTVQASSALANVGTFNAHTCSGPVTFCGTILPVELVYFKGQFIKNVNVLSWATASEINFDRFVIQRSFDGIQFEDISEIAGAGQDFQGDQQRYSFKDHNPTIGKNYYRLKSLDIDGAYEYSDVLVVIAEISKKISLFPSPSDGSSLKIITNFKPSGENVIEVFDNLGTKILEFTIDDFETALNLDSQLNRGSYFLKFSSGEFQQIIRFSVK